MSEIKAALTPEQWDEWQRGERYVVGFPQNSMLNRPGIERQEPGLRHAIAATALCGQPFGFTQEDVTLLLDAAEAMYADSMEHSQREEGERDKARVLALANRVAALLPP